MSNKNVLHAWYSPTQERVTGTVDYESVDGTRVVHVTMVSDSPVDHGSHWKDIVYLGPVSKFLGNQTGGYAVNFEDEYLDIDEAMVERLMSAPIPYKSWLN